MWSCRFHITSKTAWHENVAVQVFKIQRMQVFRPEIEPYFCCCYFKSFDRNLIFHEPIRVFLLLIVLKNFTGDARTSAETSAKAQVLISPSQTALTREEVKQPQTQADQNFSFFLRLLCACFNIFSWKRNTKLKTKECSWVFFFINQPKHSFWVRSWFYPDGRGWRKFEERVSETVCQFPVTVFIKIQGACAQLFLRLFIFPALIRVLWPHRTYFEVNFSRFS